MFPFEVFEATLTKAIDVLERHAIGFHLTGGIAGIAHGEPRMTQDVDIVVSNKAIAASLAAFCASMREANFDCDQAVVREAVERKSMFQLFDNLEALKLDFYPRELISGELDRTQSIDVFGSTPIPVASLADTILSKLIWISKGSHKSRRDVRHLFRGTNDADRQFIQEIAAEFQLTDLLAEVLAEPDEIQ